MPVMVLFKHQGRLTIAVINRRANKLDESKDVLGKVTLISGIDFAGPIAATWIFLSRWRCPSSSPAKEAHRRLRHPPRRVGADFQRRAAQRTLLPRAGQLVFLALPQVEFPADLEPDDEKRAPPASSACSPA